MPLPLVSRPERRLVEPRDIPANFGEIFIQPSGRADVVTGITDKDVLPRFAGPRTVVMLRCDGITLTPALVEFIDEGSGIDGITA